MKDRGALISALMLIATAASSAEMADMTPRLNELINRGFVLQATGELVLKRSLVPLMDRRILLHPNNRACIGAVIVTMEGPMDSCMVSDVWAYKARFYRMVRGKAEFVCTRDSSDKCHAVNEQRN